MSLTSVLQVAHSGMSAATMTLRVASNNLANSRTTGFKSQRATFTPQVPTTLSGGAAPSAGSGGSNPIQIGSGVRTAGLPRDFSQGSIIRSANPLDMALQGDGFFIVADSQGDLLFTRAGEFKLNAQGEIVTPAGHRLQGFGTDDQFQIDAGQRQSLSIPRGSTAAAGNGGPANLTSFEITESGRIVGRYSDGHSRDLGQLRIARFANPAGLEARGGNLFRASANSGGPVEANPGSGGSASVVGGASEASNTDVGRNLIDLSLAAHQFRANAEVFRTADGLLDELMHLRRTAT